MIRKYKPKSTVQPGGGNNGAPANAPHSQRRFRRPESQAPKTIFQKDKLRVIVLGGLEEVGRNMTVVEYNKEIIIIDIGLMFPEEDMYGIDYIIPNTSYLEDKTDWIRGAIITHGHMDHIGGIPHVIGKIGNPPIYTGKLTAGLIRKRCEEHRQCPVLNIAEINESSQLKLGQSFRVEFLRINHSIPDSFAVIIHTPIGTVIHTGDFKIDYSPVNDKPADLNRIAQIGGQGVLLMLSDSTDSTHPGYQISESSIGDEMDRIMEKIPGRVIIGTFASQLSRVQKIFDLAKKHNRKIYLQGRSMNDNVDIAHKIGYLQFNPRILMSDGDLKRLPDERIIILGTGAQGESNAFLVRVVTGEHRTVSLKKGDTVIFSSSVIPGNERSIQNLKDQVVRQGAHIIHYQMMDVHAGGHAKQEDLKLMMRLLKPKFFIPIEGSHYMLRAHADLAEQVGIPSENIFVPDNGQVVELSAAPFQAEGGKQENPAGQAEVSLPGGRKQAVYGRLSREKVATDYVMVDGLGVGDVSNIVLRDRRVMAEDGMIVVIATIDSRTGDTIGNPDIISRGFVYMKENRELIEKTRMKVKNLVKEHSTATKTDDDFVKNKIRNEVGQFLFSKTKRRPMVLPVVIKV